MSKSLNGPQKAQTSDRQYLSGRTAYDQGVSDNGKDSAEFRAAQTWGGQDSLAVRIFTPDRAMAPGRTVGTLA
jgi:hypothetical protein